MCHCLRMLSNTTTCLFCYIGWCSVRGGARSWSICIRRQGQCRSSIGRQGQRWVDVKFGLKMTNRKSKRQWRPNCKELFVVIGGLTDPLLFDPLLFVHRKRHGIQREIITSQWQRSIDSDRFSLFFHCTLKFVKQNMMRRQCSNHKVVRVLIMTYGHAP